MSVADAQPTPNAPLWDPLSAWPKARKPLWAAIAILIAASQGPDFLRSLYPPADRGVDFFQDWASARSLLEGQPLYTRHDQALRRHLPLNTDVDVLIPYNAHPPTSVLLAVPFAVLDYRLAGLVWNLVSLAALAASLALLVKGLGVPLAWWGAFPAVALLLIAGPFRMQMLQGQLNLVLLVLLVGVWAAERSGRERLAGGLLALATAVKLFPGLFIVYYVVRKRWTLVAAAVIWLTLLTIATAAIVGLDSFVVYKDVVLPSVRGYQGSWRNLSAAGFFSKLLDPERGRESVQLMPLVHAPALARWLGNAAALAAVVVWLLIVRRPTTRRQADLAFGLTVIAMLFISPVSWDHYLVLLLIPLAVVWAAPLDPRGGAWFLAILLAAAAPIYDLFYPKDAGPLTLGPCDSLTILSIPTYGLVALFAFLVRQASR